MSWLKSAGTAGIVLSSTGRTSDSFPALLSPIASDPRPSTCGYAEREHTSAVKLRTTDRLHAFTNGCSCARLAVPRHNTDSKFVPCSNPGLRTYRHLRRLGIRSTL